MQSVILLETEFFNNTLGFKLCHFYKTIHLKIKSPPPLGSTRFVYKVQLGLFAIGNFIEKLFFNDRFNSGIPTAPSTNPSRLSDDRPARPDRRHDGQLQLRLDRNRKGHDRNVRIDLSRSWKSAFEVKHIRKLKSLGLKILHDNL